MEQPKKWNVWKTAITAAVVGAIAIGVMSFAPQLAQAQNATATTTTTTQTALPAGMGFPGFDRHFGSNIDYEALLADALGITVDELQAAEQQAYTAALGQAVTNGDLTQEEADLMQAQEALKGYIDPQALEAKALGITVEELQAARDAGKSMTTLMDELGLTPAAVRTAQQAAYEAAIAQAVSDGVITQAQADLILSNGGGFGGRGFDLFGGHGGRGGHGGPGEFGVPGAAPDGQNAPTTTNPTGGL